MTPIFAFGFALVAAIVTPRYVPNAMNALRTAERWLGRIGAPLVAVASVAIVWFTWGSIDPPAIINDEYSYRLQADIFSHGHWVAPSPPDPEFFQQPHVLVFPAVASKYPPGHALLLAVGARLQSHAVVPLILTGASALLMFALVAQTQNVWVALLCWVVWISMPLVLRFQPSYFSELTSGTSLLAAWWCLFKWRANLKRRWLIGLALAVGWGAITRPLTMLAFALPIGIVVVRAAARHRRGADLIVAVVFGTGVLCLLPIWSAKTTGTWNVSPLALYNRDYLPIDKIGFVPDMTPPRRMLQPPTRQIYVVQIAQHSAQTLTALPRTIRLRLGRLGTESIGGVRAPLGMFAIVGVAALTSELAFAVISAVVLFAAYVPYAFPANWTVYFLEITPVIAAVIAVGLWQSAALVLDAASQLRLFACLGSTVLLVAAAPSVAEWRAAHSRRLNQDFVRLVRQVQTTPAIVFIKYAHRPFDHIARVFNYAELDKAPLWVVHDLGERDEELLRQAPHRAAFVFDEDALTMTPVRRH